MPRQRRDQVVDELAARFEQHLREAPRFFADLLALAPAGRYRQALQAWGVVRERCHLERDVEGRYAVAGPVPAAGRER